MLSTKPKSHIFDPAKRERYYKFSYETASHGNFIPVFAELSIRAILNPEMSSLHIHAIYVAGARYFSSHTFTCACSLAYPPDVESLKEELRVRGILKEESPERTETITISRLGFLAQCELFAFNHSNNPNYMP